MHVYTVGNPTVVEPTTDEPTKPLPQETKATWTLEDPITVAAVTFNDSFVMLLGPIIVLLLCSIILSYYIFCWKSPSSEINDVLCKLFSTFDFTPSYSSQLYFERCVYIILYGIGAIRNFLFIVLHTVLATKEIACNYYN